MENNFQQMRILTNVALKDWQINRVEAEGEKKKILSVLIIIEISHFLSRKGGGKGRREKKGKKKKLLYIELKSRTLSMRLIRYRDIS